MIVVSTALFCPGPSDPVVFARDLRGDSGRSVQGVQAVLATGANRSWGIIADHPGNEGVAVNESFAAYVQAVSLAAGRQPEELVWFGVQKDGRFYAWDGGSLDRIAEPAHEPGSRQAFHARLARLGLRYDGAARMMLDTVQEPFLPGPGMCLN